MLVDRSRHTLYKSACRERVTSRHIFYISKVAVALVIANHRKIGETVNLLKLVICNKTAVRTHYSTSYMRQCDVRFCKRKSTTILLHMKDEKQFDRIADYTRRMQITNCTSCTAPTSWHAFNSITIFMYCDVATVARIQRIFCFSRSTADANLTQKKQILPAFYILQVRASI